MTSREISPVPVKTYMDDSRVQAMLSTPTSLPPRKLNYGEKDLFGLASVEDTFEPIVGSLFDGCEAMEESLVSKQDRRKDVISLPTVHFDAARSYVITRSLFKDKSKQYYFQRVGLPDSGFILVRNAENHVLLKHPVQGDTPFTNDEDYGRLISQARNFLSQYASLCNITQEMMAKEVPQPKPIKAPKPKVEKVPKQPDRDKQLRRLRVGQGALIATCLAGGLTLQAYTISSSWHQGHIWRNQAVANGRQAVQTQNDRIASYQNDINSNIPTEYGQACATAMQPYSPDGELSSVPTQDAANQLVANGECNQPNQNTQLIVQNYRNDVSSLDTAIAALDSEINNYNRARGTTEDFFENVFWVGAGGVVGGVGDLAIYGILCNVGTLMEDRRKSIEKAKAQAAKRQLP